MNKTNIYMKVYKSISEGIGIEIPFNAYFVMDNKLTIESKKGKEISNWLDSRRCIDEFGNESNIVYIHSNYYNGYEFVLHQTNKHANFKLNKNTLCGRYYLDGKYIYRQFDINGKLLDDLHSDVNLFKTNSDYVYFKLNEKGKLLESYHIDKKYIKE